jgi:Rdx family
VIREQAGVDAEVVEGARSQFDVVLNGAVLFSKQAEGRFPEEGEILKLLG